MAKEYATEKCSSLLALPSLPSKSTKTLQDELIALRSGPVPPGRKYSYESGFGDFWFFKFWAHEYRWYIFREKSRFVSQEKSQLGLGPVSEEPFQLMDLPREIRDEIYRYVIRHLYTEKDFDGLSLSVFDSDLRSGGLPYRRHAYDITPTSSEHPTPRLLQRILDLMNLANTNSIIRNELSVVAWARTRITADSVDSNYNFRQLCDVLDDRPAIWNGIKELRFGFCYSRWSIHPASDLDFHSSNFRQTCDQIARSVQLEKLKFELYIKKELLENIFNGDKKPPWVHGIRKLKVIGSFELDLKITHWYEWWNVDIPPGVKYDRWMKLVAEKEQYTRWLEDILLPDSLRPKEKPQAEMTDVEKYMATHI